MKFNKDKSRYLFLGRESPSQCYRLGSDDWGAALQKTVLGTLVGSEMSMRKQCPDRKRPATSEVTLTGAEPVH